LLSVGCGRVRPAAGSWSRWATRLLGAGVDPKVVAQRGGRSKVATMLDRYAHALTVNDRAEADVLGGMLTSDR
jgi:hypothetical protein